MLEYRKIGTVRAEQFDGSHTMFMKYKMMDVGTMIDENAHSNECLLETKEGMMKLAVGDWIVTGVEGEHWAVKDRIFRKTYVQEDRGGISGCLGEPGGGVEIAPTLYAIEEKVNGKWVFALGGGSSQKPRVRAYESLKEAKRALTRIPYRWPKATERRIALYRRINQLEVDHG